jgi:DNA-directed RNA polymerase specialized sigma24 family protein
VGDFYRERAAPKRAREPLEALAAPDPPSREDAAQVASALGRLPPEIRVPFRLRYRNVLGPLPPAEVDWVAQAAGLGPEEVRRRIDQELQSNVGREFPLSAAFIDELLQLQPRPRGAYSSVVDQRVRRARDRLRELLS